MSDVNPYDEHYYRGDRAISSYRDYLKDALGPCRMLGDTLERTFKPSSSLDVGCAVGFTVKRLRELGVTAFGCDISSWAVEMANAPYIIERDVTRQQLEPIVDLVYSYDVVEHIDESHLDFTLRNMWSCCKRHLLVVPDMFSEGTKADVRDATHVTFHNREWWINRINNAIGGTYNKLLSEILENEEHSKVFSYSDRLLIFSRDGSI